MITPGRITTTVGETMRWHGTWSAANVLVDLTGYTLVAEVRRMPSRELTEHAVALDADQPGVGRGGYTVDVSGTPAGTYELRVRYTEPGGAVLRSSPITLVVEVP